MTRNALFSSAPKRKAWAAIVSDIATDALGFGVTLCPDIHDRKAFRFELAAFETESGKVDYLTFEVSELGVSVHSRFAAPEFAPAMGNRQNGKYNDYFFPDARDTKEHFRDILETFLRRYLAAFKVRHNATRADCPSSLDAFRAELDKMKAERAELAKAEAEEISEEDLEAAADWYDHNLA